MGDGPSPYPPPEGEAAIPAPEVVEDAHPVAPVVVSPTQVRHPWRATARTAFASLVALASVLPVLVKETGLDADQWPWLASVLAVCAFVTRVMADPRVEVFLRKFLPFLSATPKEKKRR